MIRDIRYVLRSLAHRRGFTAIAVLTLALGIGSATAIYSVVAWFLFRGPAAPPNIYMIGLRTMDGDVSVMPLPFIKAYSARADLFSDVALSWGQSDNVVVDGQPVAFGVTAVSPNFFLDLGVKPAMGRLFAAEEAVAGRNSVVVVTYEFWKKHLGGSANALGQQIRINETACAVVGILKEGQRFPLYSGGDVFRPIVLDPNQPDPWDPWIVCLALTRPGITRAQAESALEAMKPDLPKAMKDWGARAKPSVLTMTEVEKVFRPELYWTLLGAVGFLYAIACLNTTNLLLVRLLGRRREISVRIALGGGRWGILRLLLCETLVLSFLGAVLGAFVANWLTPLFYFMAGRGDADFSLVSWSLGRRTYEVLAGLSVATAAFTALAPAVYLIRANVQEGLKSGGGSVGESRGLSRVRASFVVLQATFAVILLVGAGLMIRTFQRLEHVQVGFDPARRVKIQLNIPRDAPKDDEARIAFLNRLRDALQRVPGVIAAAYGSSSLLADYDAVTLSVAAQDGSLMKVNGTYISADFGTAAGLRLVRGSWLHSEAKNEVLINETLARKRFPGIDPVGQNFKPDTDPKSNKTWLISGIVADVRERVRDEPTPKVYMPVGLSPNVVSMFLVQLRSDPSGEMLERLKQAVYASDPRVVTWSIMPMDQLRSAQLYDERLTLIVLRVLSCIALSLTLVGLFSVLSYTVDRRMGEFGIRMALGATPGRLVAIVVRRGLALTALGVAIGIGGAMALTRFLQSLLYETPRFDAIVVSAVSAVLLIAAAAACVFPAAKASKPDLVTLLKSPD